jgi:hypothetical protein
VSVGIDDGMGETRTQAASLSVTVADHTGLLNARGGSVPRSYHRRFGVEVAARRRVALRGGVLPRGGFVEPIVAIAR